MVSDTCEYHHALDEGTRGLADHRNERRFLMHELYGGLVGPDHPLRPELIEHGMSEHDLFWFQDHPASLDVIGLDHYPHSEHQYQTGPRGEIVDVPRPLDQQLGPAELTRQYFARLGRPMLFAETGAPGDDATRIAWLERMVSEVRVARGEGIPVIGITWWGLIDQVDWASNLRRFDYHIDPTGLYRLAWRGDVLERILTDALEAWRRTAAQPVAATVGELASVAWPQGEASLW